jgi:hypothetical protein
MDKLAEGGHAEVYQGKLLTIHASIERLMATKLKSFFWPDATYWSTDPLTNAKTVFNIE